MKKVSAQWAEAISRGRNGSDSPDALTSNFPILPWLHPWVHPRLLDLVGRLGVARRLDAGENLFRPEERVNRLVIVKSGVTARAVGNPTAQSRTSVALSTPGHIAAGNLNFFSQRHCIGRYFALTPAEVVSCPRDLLLKILVADPELLRIASLQFECCALSDRLAFCSLAVMDAESRFKALMITWAANYGEMVAADDGSGPWIRMPQPLTRADLKIVVNVTTLWIDKILAEWRQRGDWVNLGKSMVMVRPALLEGTYRWILDSMEMVSAYYYPRTIEELVLPPGEQPAAPRA